MKRLLDIIISFVLIICFSPIIIILALLVKIRIGSPIVFKQERAGLYGNPFLLYKFRTMSDKRDKYGNLLPDIDRFTPLGLTMRKYSLDELLQLINVLKGDISLVGPRPLLMDYLPLYSEEQKVRHFVKPGITGWAQINGRNSISWDEKFKLDIWYVRNSSLLLDIKILFLTLGKVLKAEGIHNGDQFTMPFFRGSKQNEG